MRGAVVVCRTDVAFVVEDVVEGAEEDADGDGDEGEVGGL